MLSLRGSILLGFILLSLFSVACGKKKTDLTVSTEQSSTVHGTEVRWIYLGDPEAILEGATTNPQLPFTANKITDYDNFQLVGILNLTEIERKVVKNLEQLQKENAPRSTERKATDYINYVFYLSKNRTRFFYMPEKNEFIDKFDEIPSLTFIQRPGMKHLELEGVGSNFNVETVHYSEIKDQQGMVQAFTILAKMRDEKLGEMLTSFHFIKKHDKISGPQNSDKNFNYKYGPGVRVRWESPLSTVSLNVCHATDEIDFEAMKETILQWNKHSPLKLQVSHQKTFGPFSDLNQNCLFLTRKYTLSHLTSGFTLMTANLYEKQYLAGSIVIFVNVLENQPEFNNTLLHEVGHFLGLAHNFQLKGSVMGYGQINEVIHDEDFAALIELYR